MPAAFVAIEDRRFYEHFGIDVIGLASVALESVQAGDITRGASTITQQVAKNLFLTPKQDLERKVQEGLLAVWLETQLHQGPDPRALHQPREFRPREVRPRGRRAVLLRQVGAQSVARRSRHSRRLAAGPVAPQPQGRSGAASRPAQKLVLSAMAKEGYISDAEANAATIDPSQTVRTKVMGAESYVADWVEGLVTAYVGDIKEDVVVYTTINWDLQKEAEFLIKEAVTSEGPNFGFSQGAWSRSISTGAVRAVVGGADYVQSQYNRAVTSRRQPGSTFKPFVYMAAMEAGYTPDTMAEDAPINIDGWAPENADGKFMGHITLREGLAYSRNTIAAQLAAILGPTRSSKPRSAWASPRR